MINQFFHTLSAVHNSKQFSFPRRIPGMDVIGHADAGYNEAIKFAEKNNVKVSMDR